MVLRKDYGMLAARRGHLDLLLLPSCHAAVGSQPFLPLHFIGGFIGRLLPWV